MIRLKTLLGAAIFSAMAFTGANACSISAWSVNDSVGVVAADAGEPTAGFKRYSARCGLQVVGAATAKYVQDNTPTNATSYKARFYFFTGTTLVDTGAAGFFYQARDGAGAPLIRLALTGGNIQTTVTGSTAAIAAIPVVANRYYSVEIEWAQGAAAPFVLTVKGAGGNAASAVTRNATTNNAAGVLKDVRLGLSATSTGTAFFDEYDSRRTTNPGRLCRGDANNSSAAVPTTGTLTAGDAQAIFGEISGTVAAGQPDFNESGTVLASDAQGIFGAISAGAAGCGAL